MVAILGSIIVTNTERSNWYQFLRDRHQYAKGVSHHIVQRIELAEQPLDLRPRYLLGVGRGPLHVPVEPPEHPEEGLRLGCDLLVAELNQAEEYGQSSRRRG